MTAKRTRKDDKPQQPETIVNAEEKGVIVREQDKDATPEVQGPIEVTSTGPAGATVPAGKKQIEFRVTHH